MICQTRTSKMLMTVPANVAAAITNEFLKKHRQLLQSSVTNIFNNISCQK